MEELSIVIQAGGESKRMGTSKALISFCGSPMICHSIKRLKGCGREMIITSNEAEKLSFLCEELGGAVGGVGSMGDATSTAGAASAGSAAGVASTGNHERLKIYADVLNQRGALNGIYTALYYAQNPYVAIVACDMVFPSAPLLKAECEALRSTGADVAIPYTSHGYEPFHAVYRKSSCLPAVKKALLNGESRANSWLGDVRVVEFTPQMILDADDRGGAFVNVNTIEELTAIETRIMCGKMTKISDEL